ncbi:MAG: 3-hydroxybutyryl-CoA dehydrogenase [Chloroflexi bacterium]|nr:3-hydroxybutyryl-CoA dehydrogenase [Chloroflexota bacterium]
MSSGPRKSAKITVAPSPHGTTCRLARAQACYHGARLESAEVRFESAECILHSQISPLHSTELHGGSVSDAAERINVVAVLGAGTMGAGIAQVAAVSGLRTRMYDVAEQFLERGRAAIADSLRRLVARGRLESATREAALAGLEPTTRLEDLADADFVIEAAPEELPLKQSLFKRLDELCPPHTILASNTSSLSITELASATRRPQQVVGLHFFNPPALMQLVEVIGGQLASAESLETTRALARRLGKRPVTARDTPGFIVNRVARPFYLESLRMLGEGLAPVETVDRAAREVAGFRMGPFELLDLIGIDVNLAVSQTVYEAWYQEPRFRPHPIQRAMVRAGQVGRKSGRGFYDYSATPPTPCYPPPQGSPIALLDPSAAPWPEWAARLAPSGQADPLAVALAARLVATLANEAALALQEGVASREDIDAAMKLGTAYPHGPLEWADQVGLPLVVRTLEALQQTVSPERYQPAQVLRRLVALEHRIT